VQLRSEQVQGKRSQCTVLQVSTKRSKWTPIRSAHFATMALIYNDVETATTERLPCKRGNFDFYLKLISSLLITLLVRDLMAKEIDLQL